MSHAMPSSARCTGLACPTVSARHRAGNQAEGSRGTAAPSRSGAGRRGAEIAPRRRGQARGRAFTADPLPRRRSASRNAGDPQADRARRPALRPSPRPARSARGAGLGPRGRRAQAWPDGIDERTCKWPIGDPATMADFWFCGRQRSPRKKPLRGPCGRGISADERAARSSALKGRDDPRPCRPFPDRSRAARLGARDGADPCHPS